MVRRVNGWVHPPFCFVYNDGVVHLNYARKKFWACGCDRRCETLRERDGRSGNKIAFGVYDGNLRGGCCKGGGFYAPFGRQYGRGFGGNAHRRCVFGTST